VSWCGMAVRSGTVTMAIGVGVPSDNGVVVMGIVGVTTFNS
jgi:hypothetical protein